MTKCLLLVTNLPEFFLSHRLPIALAARDNGWMVHVATSTGDAVHGIRELGFEHHELPLTRSGMNPLQELNTLWAFWRLLGKVSPDVLHLVTIKPVLYGGIVARLARVSGVVFAISGLGSTFVAKGLKASVLMAFINRLYRLALKQPNARVIYQNTDDRAKVLDIGASSLEESVLIRGSGINIDEYSYEPEPPDSRRVVFAARLLCEKGVMEFLEAGKALCARHNDLEFVLIGDPDPGNPSTVTEAELDQWRKVKGITVAGFRSDIAAQFASAHIVCLPSYYGEGLPKVLIEAAACGRAVVTTDHPGCRDAIIPGETGLLVPPRNVQALADAIELLLNNPERRLRMGQAGRELAEREFRIETVVAKHLDIYDELLESSQATGSETT